MIIDGSITGLGLSSFGHSVMPSSDVDLATAVNFCGEHAGAIAIELPAKDTSSHQTIDFICTKREISHDCVCFWASLRRISEGERLQYTE